MTGASTCNDDDDDDLQGNVIRHLSVPSRTFYFSRTLVASI